MERKPHIYGINLPPKKKREKIEPKVKQPQANNFWCGGPDFVADERESVMLTYLS